jgi:DNA polymerase-3 subunit epsilon
LSDDLRALPILEAPLVALDVETTGLSPSAGHRIVEIALVRREPNGERRSLARLIDPGRPIPPEASRVHGIVDDHLIGAPTFGQMVDEILTPMKGAVLLAHNAPFDLSFLDAELERAGRPRPAVPVLDTLSLARRFFRFPSNDLGTVCRCLEVRLEGAHRAEADAAATLTVLERMSGTLAEAGVTTIGEAESRSGPRGGRGIDAAVLEVLGRSFERRRTVHLLYPGREGRAERREVAIYHLAGRHLEGWCHLRGDLRRFRLDRVIEASEAERDYEVPDDFRPSIDFA